MAIKVWVRWLSGFQEQTVHEMTDCLIRQGIEVQDQDDYVSNNPGVIFSNQVTPALCEQLRELSRNGQIRILVCCDEVIPSNAVWQLLEAGAADVLANTEWSTLIQEIISRIQRWEEVDRMVHSPEVQHVLVGESQALKAILRQVVEVAHLMLLF